MPWTNVTIQDIFSPTNQMRDRIKLLEFEKELLESKVEYLSAELENIFDALKQHKEIQITNGKETIFAKLVEHEESK